MRRMRVTESVRFPQAVKLEAGNDNFLSVLIQRVHSLKLTLAMLLTDSISNSLIGKHTVW